MFCWSSQTSKSACDDSQRRKDPLHSVLMPTNRSAFLSCRQQFDWLRLAESIVQKVVKTVQRSWSGPGRGSIQHHSRHQDWSGIRFVFSSDFSTSKSVWYYRIGLFYDESAPMAASSTQLISKLARHTWQKKGTIVKVWTRQVWQACALHAFRDASCSCFCDADPPRSLP